MTGTTKIPKLYICKSCIILYTSFVVHKDIIWFNIYILAVNMILGEQYKHDRYYLHAHNHFDGDDGALEVCTLRRI